MPGFSVIPPASEVRQIDPTPLPWSACRIIVSEVPASAVNRIAPAAFRPDLIPTAPTSDSS